MRSMGRGTAEGGGGVFHLSAIDTLEVLPRPSTTLRAVPLPTLRREDLRQANANARRFTGGR